MKVKLYKTLESQGPFSMKSELPLPWASDLVYLVNNLLQYILTSKLRHLYAKLLWHEICVLSY